MGRFILTSVYDNPHCQQMLVQTYHMVEGSPLDKATLKLQERWECDDYGLHTNIVQHNCRVEGRVFNRALILKGSIGSLGLGELVHQCPHCVPNMFKRCGVHAHDTNDGNKILPLFKDEQGKQKLKCSCGTDSIGGGKHSDHCLLLTKDDN